MKKTLLIAFTLTISTYGISQDFLGVLNSNYSGMMSGTLNPANVVDSRAKTELNLLGIGVGMYNNYVGLDREAFKHEGQFYDFSSDNYKNFNDPDFAKKYMHYSKNKGQEKSLYFGNTIYMPAFMLSINDKNAFALKWKIRTLLNFDGLQEDLADLIINGYKVEDLWNKRLHNDNLSLQTMTWAEYSLNYGHAFNWGGHHFIKAGATAKLTKGLQSAYMFVKDLNYQFTTDTSLSLFDAKVNYGHSNNFDYDQQNITYKNSNPYNFAFDLGLVYEWRPQYDKYVYEMNGEKGLINKTEDKYRLKVGVSILDVGKVKFKQGPHSGDFDANVNLWNITSVNPDNMQAIDDTIRNRFNVKNPGEGEYTMNLPTVLSGQIDYNIWKWFYLNVTEFYAFKFENTISKVHEISTTSITPRFDGRLIGIGVPISYDEFGMTRVGVGIRLLNFITVGTTNLNPFFSSKDIYGCDLSITLKSAVIYPKVRDKDKDHVSDDRDRCRDVAGLWEFYGCPDRDGDHVEDRDDLCPDDAGLPEFNGCPDRDGDKIVDKIDACPDEPGLPEFNGCPDKDGDKVIDKEDECPDVAGLAYLKGCPDRDNDSIIDSKDDCPDMAGPVLNNGCPWIKLILVDSVGNTLRTSIRNKDESFNFDELPRDELVRFKLEGPGMDAITDVKVNVGPVSKKAIKDSKDGFFHFIVLKTDVITLNKKEDIIDVPIKLSTVEQEIVRKAFNNLEFASAKDIIKPESFASLDELAAMLISKPTWKLKISGHTDGQGVAAANMKLSQKRAEAVKKRLVAKGVPDDRFKVEWFGSTKPIADNKTPEGRQKNRRVEMLIIK